MYNNLSTLVGQNVRLSLECTCTFIFSVYIYVYLKRVYVRSFLNRFCVVSILTMLTYLIVFHEYYLPHVEHHWCHGVEYLVQDKVHFSFHLVTVGQHSD